MATWNDSLRTGLDWQDAQHKELVERIDALCAALGQGAGGEYLIDIISFLDRYVVKHFGDENRAMEAYQFEDAPFHIGQHTIFTLALTELKTRAMRRWPADELAEEARTRLLDWLVNHIKTMDRELGAFLKERETR